MAGSVGKMYVELDLDATKFTKAQKTILKEAQVVSTGVEKNYKTLGIKSAAIFDAMRDQAKNAYQGIAHSSRSTADDIARAQKALNTKLKQLNEEQYGHQKSLLEHLKNHWKAYSVAAIASVAAVGYAVKKYGTEVVNAAMEQEKAHVALAAALKANGDYTEVAMRQYTAFASSIQAVTTYGDEQVLKLMALQKNLGVTSDRLEEATKMSIGLATATGRDVQSMAMYIALAEKGEFTMLRRYIPALRETTDKTEQLKIVTEFAARGFQVAQEQAKTFSGSLDQLKNLWGDVKERIGDVIVKNKALLDLMERGKKTLIEWVGKIEDWVAANGELIAQKTEEYIKKIADALIDVGKAMATIGKYAGLRSISETFVEGAKLAEQELIDWDKFVKASFIERQKMVDEATKSLQTMGKVYHGVIVDTKKDIEEIPVATKKIVEANVDLADEIKRIKEEHADFFAGPFDWEADIPQIYKAKDALKSMDDQIKEIKAQHADFFAEPFDWEEPLYASTMAYTEAQEEIRKETKKTTDDNQKIWENHLESIQSGFSDTFYDIFTNLGDGFSNIFDKIKNWFLKLLADMAAAAMTKLISPLIESLTGVTSSGGLSGALSSLTGGGGGGSGGGLLSGIFGKAGGFIKNLFGMGGATGGAMSSAAYGSLGIGYVPGGVAAGSMISSAGIGFGPMSGIAALGPALGVLAMPFIMKALFSHKGPQYSVGFHSLESSDSGLFNLTGSEGALKYSDDISFLGQEAENYIKPTLSLFNSAFGLLTEESKETLKNVIDTNYKNFQILTRQIEGDFFSVAAWGEQEVTRYRTIDNPDAKYEGDATMIDVPYTDTAFTSSTAGGGILPEWLGNFMSSVKLSGEWAQANVGQSIVNAMGYEIAPYLAEVMTNAMSSGVYEFMSEGVQEALKGIGDTDLFLSNFAEWSKGLTEALPNMSAANLVWQDMQQMISDTEASIEGTIPTITKQERAYQIATITSAAYADRLGYLTGVEVTAEERAVLLEEAFNNLIDSMPTSELDDTAKSLSMMDQIAYTVQGTFDAYREKLAGFGADMEKLNNLREQEAELVKKQQDALAKTTYDEINKSIDAMYGLAGSSTSAVETITTSFKEIYSTLETIFGDAVDMAVWHQKELEALRYGMGLTSKEDYVSGRVSSISSQYGGTTQGLIDFFGTASLLEIQTFAEAAGVSLQEFAQDIAFLIDNMESLSESVVSVSDVTTEVQSVIDKYTKESVSDYQQQITEANAWKEAQLAALETITDYTYYSQYTDLMEQIAEAFGLMLDDIQTQIEEASADMKDSLLGRLYQLTMSGEDYNRYQIEMQYQRDIAEIRELEKQTGKDFSDLIAIAEQIYDAELDQIKATQESSSWESIGIGSSINAIIQQWMSRVAGINAPAEAAAISALNNDVYDMLLQMSKLLASRWGTDYMGISGWYEGSDAQLAENKEFLENIKLLYIDQIEHIRDALIDAQQRVVDSWTSAIESIQDKIYNMQISTDNPRDVEERLALVKEQIEFSLGGQTIADYLKTFETAEEQQTALSKLQEYYAEYLRLGQEAYQRPSSEYQEIYDFVIGQLQVMEELATGYRSEAELELERLSSIEMVLEEIFGVGSEQLAQWNRLNDMITHISELLDGSIIVEPIEIPPTPIVTPIPTPENNWWDNLIDLFSGGVPYYATGIDYVPNTGLAMLHEGERVTPAGYDYPEMGNQITFNITVNESKNAKATGLAVRNEVEGIIRSDWGRRLIQNTAGGR